MQNSDSTIPTHLGFIVDGNRRWAKNHKLPTLEGHRRGYEVIKKIALEVIERGVKYVSLYVFSTENWRRSEEEVSYLMGMVLKAAEHDLKGFIEKDLRIKVLGSRERLSKKVVQTIERCEAASAHCKRGTLAICLNYGGQQEIVDACKQIITKGVPVDDLTPELITQHLYAPEVPAIDMVVRTSGEQRISNFMLWRVAYSELFFIEKLWPDLTTDDVDAILNEYSRRNRRFGGN